MSDAQKRVAVVTGASRGIGAAIAVSLARQGRHVVLMARNAEKLAETQQAIVGALSMDAVAAGAGGAGGAGASGDTTGTATNPSAGGGSPTTILPCDVSDKDALVEAIEKVAKEHGRLDILVNNAGITRDNLMLRMSDEEFDEVINTNLRSVFVSCRAALRPMMRNKWGRIINIGSVSGVIGNAGQANYAAAKAGLMGLTKSLAKEMGAKNITANIVAPGFIQTDMTDVLPQQVKDAVQKMTPLGRFGQAEEVAAAVAFLASEDAGYVTGQTLCVDGGMTMC